MKLKTVITALTTFFIINTVRAEKPSLFNRAIFSDIRGYLSPLENRALLLYRAGKSIIAKELSYKILQKNPNSFVAHYLIFFSLRYDDGLLVQALYHLRIARALFKVRFGTGKSISHQIMLVELVFLLRQLGWEREALKKIELHDRLYPRFPLKELEPWAYMKLRKYRIARKLALELLSQKRFVVSAYNALCAIEFEQNHRWHSIEFCQKALQSHLKTERKIGASVHYYNLGEAYLTLFDFAKAERILIQATRFFHRSTTTEPWDVLVGLYLEQGRFSEAWQALRESKRWFLRKEPSLSESSYAKNQLTVATFLTAISMPKLASIPLDRIRDRPDRVGFSSVDVKQLIGGYYLLRSHNLRLKIQAELEEASAKNFFQRVKARLKVIYLKFLNWRTRSHLRKLLLSRPGSIIKSLSPYRSGSLTLSNNPIPNWMIAELGRIIGPAIAYNYLESVRANEFELFQKQCPPNSCQKKFPNRKKEFFSKLEPFITALQAEFLFQMGKLPLAAAKARITLSTASLLPKIQKMRLRAIAGLYAWQTGDIKRTLYYFTPIIQIDGSVLRRMEIPIPVEIYTDGSDMTEQIREALYRSPRFRIQTGGYRLQLFASRDSVAFLLRAENDVIKGSRLPFKGEKNSAKGLQRAVNFIHRQLFSPPIDLTARDIYSLDGTPYQKDDKDQFLPKESQR